MIASTDGNVTLDTGSFDYRDLDDHDHYSAVSGSLSVAVPSSLYPDGRPKPTEGAQGAGKQEDNKSDSGLSLRDVPTLEGSYSSHDTEGTSRATIAAPNGQVNITARDNPDQDLSGLNRDLSQAQTIDVDRTTSMKLDWNKDIIFGLIDLPFFDKEAWNF